MKIQQVANELEIIESEYVIAAYFRGRYEIEVYSDVRDAVDALARHKENLICVDEVRLEQRAEWRGASASSYQRLTAFEIGRLEAIEADVAAQIRQRLAQEFAGQESAEKEQIPAVRTQFAHKTERASSAACP